MSDIFNIGMQGGFGQGIEPISRGLEGFGMGRRWPERGAEVRDEQLRVQIHDLLFMVDGLDDTNVQVHVKDSVVTLLGVVNDSRTKRVIGDMAEHLAGVKSVRNGLLVNGEQDDHQDRPLTDLDF